MNITVGKSRYSTSWQTRGFSWEGLVKHLQNNIKLTPETLEQYQSMTKEARDAVKDVGGVCAGIIAAGSGRRKIDGINTAQVLIYDADKASPDFINKIKATPYSYVMYSTRSHTPEHPRWRLLLPLNRVVTAEEFMPILLRIAEDLGVENFCPSTYRINQLMYYGSYSTGGQPPAFESRAAASIDADATLARPYTLELFEGKVTIGGAGKRLGDPRQYAGLVGAFCRCYTITQVINLFLSDIYSSTDDPCRFMRIGATGGPGLLVFNDLWAWSAHATHDVCADGHDHNAFNLVKMHNFSGDFVACCDWISTKLPQVTSESASAAFAEMQAVVAAAVETHGEWASGFERADDGSILPTTLNCMLAAKYDPNLAGIAYNTLVERIMVLHPLPWRGIEDGQWGDNDDIQLDNYMTKTYTEFSNRSLLKALIEAVMARKYNPLHDKLNNLPAWDGTKRVETLFIDHLGAPNTLLIRTMTCKWLSGCWQRAFKPGIKFDQLLVLVGDQGIRKSAILQILAMGYFTDSISLRDMERAKDACEKMHGTWIAELGEMKGLSSVDKEAIKCFLSSQADTYRPSYGHHAQLYRRLTCFAGSTNREDQLSDETGNRRWWIIPCSGFVRELTEVEQVWAEVKASYSQELLYLNKEMEKETIQYQEQFTEHDAWEDDIRKYITDKTTITVAEIWKECFLKSPDLLDWNKQRRIGKILRHITSKKPVKIHGQCYWNLGTKAPIK